MLQRCARVLSQIPKGSSASLLQSSSSSGSLPKGSSSSLLGRSSDGSTSSSNSLPTGSSSSLLGRSSDSSSLLGRASSSSSSSAAFAAAPEEAPSPSPSARLTTPGASPIRVVVCTLIPGGGCMPAAMTVLGFKPYQFFNSIRSGRRHAHPQAWTATLLQSQPIPPAILDGKDCLVGPPGASAVAHLVATVPRLRVILVQEQDKETLGPRLHESIQYFYKSIPKLLDPQARSLLNLLYPNQTARVSAASLAAYEDVLLERVPREQLLVYTYGDGWEPLCDFLEVDLPEETVPFPAYDDGTAELAQNAVRIKSIWRWSLFFFAVCSLVPLCLVVGAVLGNFEFFTEVVDSYKDLQVLQQEQQALQGAAKPGVTEQMLRDAASEEDQQIAQLVRLRTAAAAPGDGGVLEVEAPVVDGRKLYGALSVKRYTVSPKGGQSTASA